MATFAEFWRSMVRKYPDLGRDDAKLEFTSQSLRRLLAKVYDKGREHGKDDVRGSDLFRGLFGD